MHKSAADVKAEIPVLLRSLKSSWTSFQLDKTFWRVGSADGEQSGRKAKMVAQGDWQFSLEAGPRVPLINTKRNHRDVWTTAILIGFLLITNSSLTMRDWLNTFQLSTRIASSSRESFTYRLWDTWEGMNLNNSI